MLTDVEAEPDSNSALRDSLLEKLEGLPDKDAKRLRGILSRAMCDFLDSDQ